MHAKVVTVGRDVLNAFIPRFQVTVQSQRQSAEIRGHSMMEKISSGKEELEALILATLKT